MGCSRHVDTAQAYRNEAHVGAAVQQSGLPREEVFVSSYLFFSSQSTRIWATRHTLAVVVPAAACMRAGMPPIMLMSSR